MGPPTPVAPAEAGVAVTQNAQPRPAQWPGTPVVSTVANPANAALDNLSFNHDKGATSLGQTFRVPTACQLTRISLFGGDGLGTAPAQPVTLALYDLGPTEAAAASPSTYAPSPNLLGAGKGLKINYTPQAAGLLNFDFTGPNQVPLLAGHTYAFELQGVEKSAPLFWRVSRQEAYADGSAYLNRAPAMLNDKRGYDFALAVYGRAGGN
ncbi:hypothetical protein BEN49_20415 [Hymenobacter coccineus]|uniref:Uncharacterized protein n=1 Tax=Hymenobacter coccineus TaxID=1908235 RepID=A0A1G1TK74_9BACT|nr:hypothetical protein BEN49_20415 [Hymenobacter coccineus]